MSISPLNSSSTHIFSMLHTAAEQMMVHKDFHAALETCDRGLESLCNMELEDTRCGELKTGLCTLGIQALAELNQWHCVLPWVLQQYEQHEQIPAKIMQMCILLYSKVGEPGVMQEVSRLWLGCAADSGAPGLGAVAELYLLHVLVPLGQADEARQLVEGAAFTEEQRQTALDIVEERQREIQRHTQEKTTSPGNTETAVQTVSAQGGVTRKLEAVIKCFYRKLFVSGSGSFPLRRLLLAAVLLYMLLLRMDPALPSSFMWISKLLQLLRQMWSAMFAPYYQAQGK